METGCDVGIVGGGVRALYAAYRLTSMGKKVKIFEKSGRLGGKLFTQRTSNGEIVGELGAMRILNSHKTLLSLLQEFNISLSEFQEDNKHCPFVIGELRGQSDNLNLSSLVQGGVISQDIIEEANLDFNMSFFEVLLKAFEEVGENELELSLSAFLDSSDPTKKCARSIIELTNGKDGAQVSSIVGEFQRMLKSHDRVAFYPDTGFDSITNELKSRIPKNSILTNHKVTLISQSSSRTELKCKNTQNGVEKTFFCKQVLLAGCTLQGIEFEPSLPQRHLRAKNLLLQCENAFKAVYLFKENFWSASQGTGGVSLISSEIHQIIYPQQKESKYLMIYLHGKCATQWNSKADRKMKGLMDIQRLFPDVDVQNLFVAYFEKVWVEPGSGGFYLSGTDQVEDLLLPWGNVYFSCVPPGWIEDCLVHVDRVMLKMTNSCL